MVGDVLDRAEDLVDDAHSRHQIWGGSLVPRVALRLTTGARDRMHVESVVERAQVALVSMRVRFHHLTGEFAYTRVSGTWVLDRVSSPTLLVGDVVRQDVSMPMPELTQEVWRPFAGTAGGSSTRREQVLLDGSSRLIESISQPLTWSLEVSARPFEGPHGLIRLRARLRNTTEPLAQITDPSEAQTYSLVGCHIILALDRGKFVPLADPPEYARPYVARCVNEGTAPLIADPAGKVLLATLTG